MMAVSRRKANLTAQKDLNSIYGKGSQSGRAENTSSGRNFEILNFGLLFS